MAWAFTHRTNPILDDWADEPDYSRDGVWYNMGKPGIKTPIINDVTWKDNLLRTPMDQPVIDESPKQTLGQWIRGSSTEYDSSIAPEHLFVVAARIRYEAQRGAARSWEDLGEANQEQWIEVMRTSAAALSLARKQIRGNND